MNRKILLLLLGMATWAAPSWAQVFDDGDLGGRSGRRIGPALSREARGLGGVFQAEKVERILIQVSSAQAPGEISGSILLADPQGQEQPGRRVKVVLVSGTAVLAETQADDSGAWLLKAPANAKGGASVRFRLQNNLWLIKDPQKSSAYEWELQAVQLPLTAPLALPPYRLRGDTENGKIGFIYLQFFEAWDAFNRLGVSTSWWTKRLTANYPAGNDAFYGTTFSLNLTRAEAWDVNLHELGHAVASAGTNSYGGGGAHRIGECYNQGVAWSEGFATFLAGVIRLSPDDADAKFEFLVPRLAPIRIENVPDTVCQGDTNEWRVAAALWDLHDSHPDGGDDVSLGFPRIWKAIQGQSIGGFPHAWDAIKKGLSGRELAAAEASLRHNTVLAPLAVKKPLINRAAIQNLAAPAFD